MKTTRNGIDVRQSGRAQTGRAAPAASAGWRLMGAVGGFMRKRPGFVLAVLAVSGGGGLVGWNALTQQANKHPAPLFGPKLAAAPSEPPRRSDLAAAPLPVPMPVPRPDITQVTTTQSIPEPARTGADPIGNLIRTGNAPVRPAEVKPDTQRVLTAQKALSKLGYGPLKADGLMGLTTKQAVERFERDKNLPVTGALSPRTSRQLASASGIQIE